MTIYLIIAGMALWVAGYWAGARRTVRTWSAEQLRPPVPNVARVIVWNLDLDAVAAAGERAAVAVGELQRARGPRQFRHLRAVA